MASIEQVPRKETPEWIKTIDKVSLSGCQVTFYHSDAADVHLAASYQATGFYVDEKGRYILTNRHVTGDGLFWGFVVFDQNHEVRYAGFGCFEFDNDVPSSM